MFRLQFAIYKKKKKKLKTFQIKYKKKNQKSKTVSKFA